MKLNTVLPATAAICGLVMAAFYLGRFTASTDQQIIEYNIVQPEKAIPQAPILSYTTQEEKLDRDRENSQRQINEAKEAVEIENYEYEQSLATAENLRSLIEDAPESEQKYAEIQSIKQALLDRARVNTEALEGIITAYKNQPDSVTGGNLQAVLAEIKDPEVQGAAIDLAKTSEPEKQLAGLNLLSQLNIPSEERFQLTSQLIEISDNPEVIMAAVDAMPEMPLPDNEFDQVIDKLNQLVNASEHEGVRSASLFKLGKLAKEGDELKAVMNTLSSTASNDDRISAAMALKQSPIVNEEIKEVLVARVKDENELWEIRRLSAESLKRFKLSQSDYSTYQNFIEQQGDVALGR